MNREEYINKLLLCNELYIYSKKALIAELAQKLEVSPENVFYTWCGRRIKQSGILNENYKYFFHGCECDFRSREGGEYIRVDFGPGGRIDTFTAFGLSSFIKTCLVGVANVFPDLVDEDVYIEIFRDEMVVCPIGNDQYEMRDACFDESLLNRLIVRPSYRIT